MAGYVCLTRKKNEKIIIGGNIEVVVSRITTDRVRLAILAPDNVIVDREEVHLARAAGAPVGHGVVDPGWDRCGMGA